MTEFIKSLGVIVLLIGVLVLIGCMYAGAASNSALLLGLGLIIGGFLFHIFLNKKVE